MNSFQTFLKPNESGYVTNWLVCGAKEQDYKTEYFDPNQLAFEKHLREIIADDDLEEIPADIKLGEKGLDDLTWKYYQAGNNWFVDFSNFYFLLTKVELYASTVLCVPNTRKVNVRLWTFAAVELWLNGTKQAKIKEPVYKPINYVDMELELQAGANDIFIRMQNLGVRDTRNIFGLQIRDHYEDITVKTHDYEHVYPLILAEQELVELVIREGKLVLGHDPARPIIVNGEVWEKGSSYPVTGKQIKAAVNINGTMISRLMENSLCSNIRYSSADTLEEHRAMMRLAYQKKMEETIRKTNETSDAAYRWLVKFGIEKELRITLDHIYRDCMEAQDIERVKNALSGIENCEDCADFQLLEVLVIMDKAGEKLPAEFVKEVKRVILNFRYWMDEQGSDGMCFWSENHAIGFFACQLLAGKLYPDEFFERSGRTGRQQYEIANSRCREWLNSIEETGFEEFFSPGYMSVTFRALLAVIDHGEEDVSERAWKVQDSLIRGMFTQSFDGVLAAPHGRIYGTVIHPAESDFQEIYAYFNKDVPFFTAGRMAAYHLSKYKAPKDVAELLYLPVNKKYQTGNAEVSICKTKDYILTSVSSERSENYTGGWSGEEVRKEDPYKTGKFSFMYVKALNEKYHGTTLFQPGVYGYQQHMWTAALSKECLVFVNHPGATNHDSAMRPGYWYGNGLFPALQQWDNTLLAVYKIADKHPIHFTHVYFPKHTFDEVKEIGNWVFGRNNDSMIALWCSTALKPHHDVLSDCEYRAYGDTQGYVCICSDMKTEGTFEAFCNSCLSKEIVFDEDQLLLNDGCGHELQFVEKYNDSQVI